LHVPPFKPYRGQVASGTMPTDWVAKHLDVVEYVRLRLVPGWIDPSLDPLLRQRTEEALSHRIVVAVSSPAHARNDAVLLQQ